MVTETAKRVLTAQMEPGGKSIIIVGTDVISEAKKFLIESPRISVPFGFPGRPAGFDTHQRGRFIRVGRRWLRCPDDGTIQRGSIAAVRFEGITFQ